MSTSCRRQARLKIDKSELTCLAGAQSLQWKTRSSKPVPTCLLRHTDNKFKINIKEKREAKKDNLVMIGSNENSSVREEPDHFDRRPSSSFPQQPDFNGTDSYEMRYSEDGPSSIQPKEMENTEIPIQDPLS
mmetsp:Transcript_24286/g.37474  ORF Transcript_24286/g.37474 Transcript_24286/m.37474 type:complete len:132 (-) Transcript_24286:3202-3597(-)